MRSNASLASTEILSNHGTAIDLTSPWIARQTRRSDLVLIAAVVAPMSLLTLAAALLPSLPVHLRILGGAEALLLVTFCWAWFRHCRAFAAVALGEGYLLVQRANGAVERFRMPDALHSLEQEYGFVWVAFREAGRRIRLSDYMFLPEEGEVFRTWLLRHGVRLSVARQDFISKLPNA